MRRRAALVALVLLAAACGSSSSKSSSPTTVKAKAEANASAGVFNSTKCAEAVKDMSAVGAKMGQAMSGQAGDLEQTIKDFNALADASPSDIRADMKVLAKAYSSFMQAMVDAHITAGAQPSADDLQKLEAASKAVDTDEVKAAGDRVQTWFQTKCGK